MSRTTRKLRPRMELGNHLGHKQYWDKSVRDGTPQHVSVHCNHHGLCAWCRGSRLFKHKRNELIDDD